MVCYSPQREEVGLSANELPDTPVGQGLSRLIGILQSPGGPTREIVTDLFDPGFVRALGSHETVAEVIAAPRGLDVPAQRKDALVTAGLQLNNSRVRNPDSPRQKEKPSTAK